MGGWMTYQRMRSRNGLLHRKPDDDRDPYWRGDQHQMPPGLSVPPVPEGLRHPRGITPGGNPVCPQCGRGGFIGERKP